jgi:DNA-directed RNA polymerase alpha subunit
MNELFQPSVRSIDRQFLRLRRRATRQSIADLELSVRATNCLEEAKIRLVSELVSKTENDLLNLPKFGMVTLGEVKRKLAHYTGLELKGPRRDTRPKSKQCPFCGGTGRSKNKVIVSDKLSSMSIADLKLSVRVHNRLTAAKIQLVSELVNKTENDLLNLWSFGLTSLREVKRKLADMGLELIPCGK